MTKIQLNLTKEEMRIVLINMAQQGLKNRKESIRQIIREYPTIIKLKGTK